MRTLAWILAAAWLAASASTLSAQARPPVPVPRPVNPSISPSEQQIREGVVKFVELYNAKKAKELAALFAPEARVVYRDGTEVNGRDEIVKSFEAGFAASPKAAISVVVDSIRFLTADVAVEEGDSVNFPDGETQTSRSRYTVLHVKRDGVWQMQAIRTEEEESLSAYGDLQPLEWLIGDWIDEGRSENVESTFRWDVNKSFLIEEFKVVREGAVVLQGTQRIGWDPQAKQVRSWVFDSAGGFGEASWVMVGDAWVVKAKGVMADGASNSATRVLIPEGSSRVVWSSKDRLLGSEVLPDITVTMVRKAPAAK